MTIIRVLPILPSLVVLAVLAFGQPVTAGETPYGDRDFYPTPERPIGFRGDGNGYFPGATPVTEFWEGTLVEKEQEYPGKRGPTTGKYLAITDDKSKNLVWKTEMPSWANTHPIVVGDKVFTLGEPDRLICTNAATGEVLWTGQARVWDSLLKDRAEADRVYAMFEIYLSLSAVIESQFKDRQPRWSPEKFKPIRDTMVEHSLPRMVAALAKLDAATPWAEKISDVVAGMDLFLQGADNFSKAGGMVNAKNGLRATLKRRIEQLGGQKVDIDLPWGNMIGWCMSVPVSDGQHVYASFGQGQLACFDLDGKLIWQQWMEPNYGRTDPVQSPLLRGKVLVSMHGGSKELRGVDTATGKILWRAPTSSANLKRTKGGYFVGSHKILTLTGKDGATVDVVVTTLCNIIRLADGKVVGYLDWPWDYGPSGGPSIFNCGNIVYRSANGDGGGCPFTAWRLDLIDRDTVKAEKIWHIGEKGSPGYHGQVSTGTHLIMTKSDSTVVNGITGEVLVKSRGKGGDFGELSNILAGHYLLWAEGGSGNPLMGRWGGRRFDGKVAHRFHAADFTDPAHPKPMATTNVLGGENIPRFPPFEAWVPELYEARSLWGNWNGLPAHFLHVDTGMIPHGDRLFIRSVSHLYCIGDPAKPWHTPAGAPPSARVERK